MNTTQIAAPTDYETFKALVKKIRSEGSAHTSGQQYLLSLFEVAAWYLDEYGHEFPEGVDVLSDNLCGATILLVGTRREVLDAQLWLTLRLDEQISKRQADCYPALGKTCAVCGSVSID